VNVSDGIVRTAKELRAETVLVGWGEERTTASRFFGTVLENLLEECPTKMILCRLGNPLNNTGRLLLPIPPLFELRSDLMALFGDVQRLAREIAAAVHVYASDSAPEGRLSPMLDDLHTALPTSVETASDWNETLVRLLQGVRPGDMAILPLERRQSPLWSPESDRLFELMVSRFPDMNLLALYPALPAADSISQAVVDRSVIAVVPTEEPRWNPAGSVEDALRQMVRNVPSWTGKQQDAVHALLVRCARTHPVEWDPGRVLLHAHSEVVDTTTLLIGTGDWAWMLPGCVAPARLIVALVASRDQSPESHLKVLAGLARGLHAGGIREKLDSNPPAADIAAALRNHLISADR